MVHNKLLQRRNLNKSVSLVLFIFLFYGPAVVHSESFQLSDIHNGRTTIQFTPGAIQTESIGEYTRFVSPNSGKTTEQGMPELPLFSTFVQIDPIKEYLVSYSVIQSHTLENIKIYPFQNDREGKNPSIINHVNLEYYESGHSYPEENLIVSDRLVMRGLQLFNISIVPFEYNPTSNEMVVYNEIEITVEEIGDRESDEFTPQLRSRTFEKLYETMIVNYSPSGRDEDYQAPAILYICGGNSEDNSYFQQLVDWRHKRGYVVYTASISETGSSSSQVKSYVTNAYNTFSPRPEFVALVGDAGGSYNVPTFYEDWGHDYYGDWCEGDHPYSQLDGDDLLPEVLVGRISVRSSSHISNVVNRIINYEKATYLGSLNNFYERAAVVGDPSESGLSTVITARYVENIMEAYGMEDINLKISGSSWTSWMENQLDEGVSYFQYRGFYGVSGFDTGDIDDVNNGHKLPFATVLTCGTGSFAQDNTCLSEKFLRAGSASNPRGAIAAVCTATGNTHTMFNNIVAMGIYDGLFPKNLGTAGAALANGKLTLFSAYPTNPYHWVDAFTQWNSLMGDPATHLWTDTPTVLSVTHPFVLPFGTNFVDILVYDEQENPAEDAMVTLLMDDDVIFTSGYTDEEGSLTMNLDYVSNGTISITVTKQNCKPYENTIILHSDGAVVNLDNELDVQIHDDDDGIVNPGEQFGLSVPVKNYGTENVYGISATLQSFSEFVTISDATMDYGDLLQGESAFGDDFAITLSETAIDREDLKLRLTIVDNSNNGWNAIIPIDVSGSHLAYMSMLIQNGGIDPGETKNVSITLSNRGSISTGQVFATLSSDSYALSVVDGSGAWGEIPPGQSVQSTDSFTISASNEIINGTVLSLSLNIQSDEGYNRVETIPIHIGEVTESDPLGPDSYGYYIYDSWDTGYELAPAYDWIEIESIGTNLDIYDPGRGRGACSLNNNMLCDSDYDCDPWGGQYYGTCEYFETTKEVNLPFTFSFYGVPYSSISVSSNGWIAFGHSELESFRNYPVPGAGGPSPMVAVFWDDLKTSNGGYVYTHNFDGEFMVIQWTDMRTEDANSLEDFQLILYNNSVPPYGDGEMKLQYKTFNNTTNGSFGGYTPEHGGYCTVGIENHNCTTGLEYTFDNEYPVAARTIVDQSALFITTRPAFEINETTITVSNYPGWNIVGLPVDANDANYLSIFPNAINNTLYSYDGSYTQEENLALGTGYWLRFSEEGENQIVGLPINSLSIAIQEGWNLISGITSTVEAGGIIDPSGLIVPGTMYSYNENGYANVSSLEPGTGYWIRSFGDGTITLQSSRTSKVNDPVGLTSDLETMNKIRFNGAELYFGATITENEQLSYSLPPKPPSGAFDARFSGDWKYCSDEGMIEVMNNGQPLVVEYEVKDGEYWQLVPVIAGKTEWSEAISLSGQIQLNLGSNVDQWVLRKSTSPQTPTVFALHSNYPNPFNPATRIMYDVPQETHIRLTVNDLLGREVITLVNQIEQPGFKTIMWNGRDHSGRPLSSGIYISRLETKTSSFSKKMLLLK
ncbi:MAG: C25 family cysteine peptidase [Candidatus Marinimicrobia bacterium]|nr:C25 family cysteine peptidase [Candidatus Neomarinimicrobiota bacterium]